MDRAATLDRARVRAAFERRFTARRMAEDYLEVYERLSVSDAEIIPPRRAGREDLQLTT